MAVSRAILPHLEKSHTRAMRVKNRTKFADLSKKNYFCRCMTEQAPTEKHLHRLITFPRAADARGNLCAVENGAELMPFRTERVFWISGVPAGQERGYHAHRLCSELLFAVQGSLDVELTDSEGCVRYHLDSPEKGLFIPPMCWCRLLNFSQDALCVCLSDRPFEPNAYINDYELFEQELLNHGKK